MAWQRFEGLTETRRWLLLIFLIGWMHAGAYALLVPLWQAPDEPGHYEVACLLSQVKRPLTGDDLSLPLQRDILANLAQHEFWTQVHAPRPTPLPLAFADDPFLARSGRQVGDEPPLYYLIPALICRTGLSIEARLRLIRLFGALLFGLTGVVAVWGVRGEGRQIGEHLEGAGSPALPIYQSTNLPFLPFLPLLSSSSPCPPSLPGRRTTTRWPCSRQRRCLRLCCELSGFGLDLAPRRRADSAAVAGVGQQENQQLSAAVVDDHRPGAWLALAETSCLAAQRRGEDRSRRLACRHHPALARRTPLQAGAPSACLGRHDGSMRLPRGRQVRRTARL